MKSALLTVDTVADYLAGRGVIDDPAKAEARALGGGVSNVVLAVTTPDAEVVVKQSLPKLRVAEEWLAKQERAITEAAALRLAAGLTPGAVPEVLDVDEPAFALTIACAPGHWVNWKDELLAGRADVGVAAELGRLLAAWHVGTTAIDARFDDQEAFEQLRVDPYYRTAMARHPDLARPITDCIERMAATRQCLVHGDYSPKNVLLAPEAAAEAAHGAVWVLDFEVAHLGDPAFDLAFLHNHLVLKAIHRPAARDAYRACAEAFDAAYTQPVHAPYVRQHQGCLLLARVDGKSPAEYLTEDERTTARAMARTVISEGADPWGLL
jgi:aminoglycoside phosphotransferase (APT) family kinase protein